MKQELQPDYVLAHEHCRNNRDELQASELCGCFYCHRIYSPREIENWAAGDTAICAYCPVDSVIGSKSRYPITEEFLQKMYNHWFGITWGSDEARAKPPAMGSYDPPAAS